MSRRTRTRPRAAAALSAVMIAALTLLLQACGGSPAAPAAGGGGAPPGIREVAQPVGPHGGVNLNVLVLSDGGPPVEALRGQLAAEGMPVTVISLKNPSRQRITSGFLTRTLAGGTKGGNFDGVVLPSDAPSGLDAGEMAALAGYERAFGVRQADASVAPGADTGMSAPSYSGPLSGTASVTSAGAADGFGYLNSSFPFGGTTAGGSPYGYLASPRSQAVTPLVTATAGGSGGTLVWQYADGGRQVLAAGFPYASYTPQFYYLARGIVSWLTRGVNLTDWRSYLDIAYDDMFLGDAQWSTAGHCTPGDNPPCPKGVPATPMLRMTPADVTYAAAWEKRHGFRIELVFNGGASRRFLVHGTDPLLAAARPAAGDFYWVNHTWTHAYFGCQQNFTVVPWTCDRSGGQLVWAAGPGLINGQISQNFAWARRNGIPAEPGTLVTGEYSGLMLTPQQPVDNPSLDAAMGATGVRWIALDASREPVMRAVGSALGVPRHPIDIGYDVDTIAKEVNEFNWNNDSRADGGSGLCQGSKVTACLKPITDAAAGWNSVILPGQAQIVYQALLAGDARPFFLHQSNLTGGRIAYPVMEAVLSAYRAVFSSGAPVENLPMSGDGAVLRDRQLWQDALNAHAVNAWVDGGTVTVSAPPGTPVPVTLPGGAGGPSLGSYGGARSGWVTAGSKPLTFTLGSRPYQS